MTRLLLFPDIETTGLNDDSAVLEVAWGITDESLNLLLPPRSFIVEHEDRWDIVWSQLKDNDFVRNMHHESGLVADLKAKKAYPMQDIMDALNVDLTTAAKGLSDRELFSDGLSVPVTFAGMSVEFDRQRIFETFLGAQKDNDGLDLGWFFHHSLFNLSSLRIERELAGLEPLTVTNSRPHRAAYDVIEGIERAKAHVKELRALTNYRQNVAIGGRA